MMRETKKCSSCEWFNGEPGDCIQFCDEKETYVDENNNACFRYKHKEEATQCTTT